MCSVYLRFLFVWSASKFGPLIFAGWLIDARDIWLSLVMVSFLTWSWLEACGLSNAGTFSVFPCKSPIFLDDSSCFPFVSLCKIDVFGFEVFSCVPLELEGSLFFGAFWWFSHRQNLKRLTKIPLQSSSVLPWGLHGAPALPRPRGGVASYFPDQRKKPELGEPGRRVEVEEAEVVAGVEGGSWYHGLVYG